jgi:CBS domain-containing protein
MLAEEDFRAALREMKTYMDVTEEDLKNSVQDEMTKAVVAVKRDADLQEAARILSENKVSGMPVLDDGNRVIGVISEADLLLLAGIKKDHTFLDVLRGIFGAPAPAPAGERVGDVMSSPALTVSPDDNIGKAAAIIDERRIKRLPVVDGEGRLVGIISRADIVRTVGGRA